MKELPESSIDLVLCDLPYGTTQNKWDTVLPLDILWPLYRRVCKGAVVLTATQPFSSLLVMSNIAEFKYEWIWQKSRVTGVLNAKKQPLRQHEVVLIFQNGPTIYNPQGLISCSRETSTGKSKAENSSSNYGMITQTETGKYTQTQTNYPVSVLKIASEGKTQHPTQKPVALMEYLIQTYSNPGAVVLDNCMGAGTTGVAAIRTGRDFIGMENNEAYFKIAEERIAAA